MTRLPAVLALILVSLSLIAFNNLKTYRLSSEEEEQQGALKKVETSANKSHDESLSNCSIVSVSTVQDVCSFIPHWTAGSSMTPSWTLWKSMEMKIRRAARESLDDCWGWDDALKDLNETAFSDLTARMFSALHSHRLDRALKSKPNPLVMERVLQVILRRLKDPTKNPPLRIAVFGGSVTQGCWSGRNFLGLHQLQHHCDSPCTWTIKLERLLNAVLGNNNNNNDTNNETEKQVVVVRNYAVGGTDSAVGSLFLEYNLWKDPEYKSSDFDVFIAAYSSNDGQSPGAVQDALFESMQRFLRLCMDQRPCSDLPLVIQLEDTMLDAYHSHVRVGLRFMRDMAETANWAEHVMSVSYADATRYGAYRNPTDQTLTEFGELHPGLTFHTGVAWTLAYSLLQSLMGGACNAPSLPEYHEKEEPRAGHPLPILHDELRSEDVHSLWNATSMEKARQCATGRTATTCMYKWVAMMQDAKSAQHIQQAIDKYATHVDGWRATGFPIRRPRRTFQAEKTGANFTLQWNDLESPINRLMVLYLRSYGPKWESTQLRVVVEGSASNGNWTNMTQFELEGAHDSETSINYSHVADLGSFLQQGSSVRVHFTLVGGSVFQINGLALCHAPGSVETK